MQNANCQNAKMPKYQKAEIPQWNMRNAMCKNWKFKSKLQDAKYKMSNARCNIRIAECKMQNEKYKMQDAKRMVQKCEMQYAE